MSLDNPQFRHRRFDLDWLRVLAVLLVVVFHAAAVFYQGDLGVFYVVNQPTSRSLSLFITFVYQWHMPLFFFLAGAAAWFSLSQRTPQQYLQERFQRLFIPFLFGTLFFVPPQVYYQRLSESAFKGSYFQFYPHFFNGIRPTGNFEWAHLWFIVYLFVLSIVALPVLIYLQKPIAQNWHLRLTKLLSYPGGVLALAIPLAIVEAVFRPRWYNFQNLYDDWANVLLYLFYFIYGYWLIAHAELRRALERDRILLFGGAIALMSVLFGLWMIDAVPARAYSLPYMSYQALRGVNTWCWVLSCLSIGQRWLNFAHPWLKYANESAYPVYILHQTVIVAIAFYVSRWNTEIVLKFIVISTSGLIITLLLYELCVRRTNIFRLLLGLKPLIRPL